MKQKILLAIALLVSVGSFAQRISFGAGAGATHFSMRGDAVNSLQQLAGFTNGIVSTKPVAGFYGGGYANIALGGNISLEPGVYYSTKGYQISGSYTVKELSFLTANASARLLSNYIDVPVLLKADFNGLQLFAGPQLSYLTSATLKTNAAVAGISLFSSSMDMSQQLNRWDAAITAGIGYQFANGIRLNAAYERGLSKVDAGKSTESYNQGFRVGAAMRF